MNLWHYELLPYLPDSLIKNQWEDLKSSMNLFEKEPKYDKRYLSTYTCMVLSEMEKRKLMIFGLEKPIFYFNWEDEFTYLVIPKLKDVKFKDIPFPEMFTRDYLLDNYADLIKMCYFDNKLDEKDLYKVKDYIENSKETKDGNNIEEK